MIITKQKKKRWFESQSSHFQYVFRKEREMGLPFSSANACILDITCIKHFFLPIYQERQFSRATFNSRQILETPILKQRTKKYRISNYAANFVQIADPNFKKIVFV